MGKETLVKCSAENCVEGVFFFMYFSLLFGTAVLCSLHVEHRQKDKGLQKRIFNNKRVRFWHGNLKSETLYQYGCLKNWN